MTNGPLTLLRRLRLLLQVLLTSLTMLLSAWVHLPWYAIGSVGLICVSLLAVELLPTPPLRTPRNWQLYGSLIATMVVVACLLLGKHAWEPYYAWLAWMPAVAILLIDRKSCSVTAQAGWRALALVWAVSGDVIWLAVAYSSDRQLAFYSGLLLGLVLLLLVKRWFRLPFVGTQIVNTLILFFVGLPLVDLFLAPADFFDATPTLADRAYSYEVSKDDPAEAVRWWNLVSVETKKLWSKIFVYAPGHVPDFRLRPNSQVTFFQSRIRIDSNGFRGREVPASKGTAYRIVALGESTTFGITLAPDDKPWPDVLEQIIQKRLRPKRPVEVINAGVPSYNLEDNLRRLTSQILPLKPDMIISYHGYNGFRFVDSALPPVRPPRPPPRYQRRPVKLLADCEYRLKMTLYKRKYIPRSDDHKTYSANLMETRYAKDYRRLIQFARTNHIRLVLATFSMAVNLHSNPDVRDFYRSEIPWLHWLLEANVAHTRILEKLARTNPDFTLVNTHPQLDGHYNKFIDLVHFTQQGREQLAENIFTGIKKALQTDLEQATDPRFARPK